MKITEHKINVRRTARKCASPVKKYMDIYTRPCTMRSKKTDYNRKDYCIGDTAKGQCIDVYLDD